MLDRIIWCWNLVHVQKFVHELRITNQVMYLNPPVEEVRMNVIGELYAWESNILTLSRITHSRYQASCCHSVSCHSALWCLWEWKFCYWHIISFINKTKTGEQRDLESLTIDNGPYMNTNSMITWWSCDFVPTDSWCSGLIFCRKDVEVYLSPVWELMFWW